MEEPVFRALPMASEKIFAFLALRRELIFFIRSKLLLYRTVHHLRQCLCLDIPEFVFREYEMVASVHVAIELHYPGVTTMAGQGADPGLLAYPVGQGGIE